MPNLNVTYAEMQAAASQLKAGEQQIQGDLGRLMQLIDNLVTGGYVTDASSKKFEAAYTDFNTGAGKVIQGLMGMGQYLDTATNTFQDADNQLAASLNKR
jgi:WXG100 family type VII secretion target